VAHRHESVLSLWPTGANLLSLWATGTMMEWPWGLQGRTVFPVVAALPPGPAALFVNTDA